MASGDTTTLTVEFCTIEGHAVPQSLVSAFVGAGFSRIPPESDDVASMLVIWAAKDSARGLETLRDQPRKRRRSTVLVGEHLPNDIGPRVREAGGLTYANSPPPPWLMALLGPTVRRSAAHQTQTILDHLHDLYSVADTTSGGGMLALAEQIGGLLHASRVIITRREHPGAPFGVVSKGTSAAEAAAACNLSGVAARYPEISVIPDLHHARRCSFDWSDTRFRSAVSVPLHLNTQRDALVLQSTAAINLFWETPRIPTADEMAALEICGAFGTTVLGWFEANKRLSQAQLGATEALAALVPRPTQAAEYGLDTVTNGSLCDALEECVLGLMEQFRRTPDVASVHVRLDRPIVDAPSWIHAGPPLSEEPEVLLEQLGAQRDAECARGFAVRCVGPSMSPRMHLLIRFAYEGAATVAHASINGFVAELDLAYQLFRRNLDAHRIAEIARELAHVQSPRNTLAKVAKIVESHTGSDGCKFYAVLRVGGERRLAQLMHLRRGSTALEAQSGRIREREASVLLNEERGLADWVILHDDWLLIDDPAEPGETGLAQEQGQSGRHGRVGVMARLDSEYGVYGSTEEERAMLFVPVHHTGKTAGAVAVWRDSDTPYDVELDIALLQMLAPYVVSGCWRVLHDFHVQEEQRFIRKLNTDITVETTLYDAHRMVTEAVGRLAGACAAVLVHHDQRDGRLGHLYFGAAWTEDETEIPDSLRGLHFFGGTSRDHWIPRGREKFTEMSTNTPWSSMRLRTVLPMGKDGRGFPLMGIVVLDRASKYEDISVFARDVVGEVSPSFLASVTAMLNNHLRAHASHVVDKLDEPKAQAMSPDEVLHNAARLLERSTSCDGVLVYCQGAEGMVVKHSEPSRDAIIDQIGVVDGSLTEQSVRRRKVLRVLDVSDPEEPDWAAMDRDQLAAIATRFDWDSVRSWVCVPVVNNGRCIGLIKILNSTRNGFLGERHEYLAGKVASSAAWQIQKLYARQILAELNAMSADLAAHQGRQLHEALVQKMETKVAQFVGPNCWLVIDCWFESDTQLIRVASEEVISAHLERLHQVSLEHKHQRVRLLLDDPPSPTQPDSKSELGLCAVGEPIRINGVERLAGHLFVLSQEHLAGEHLVFLTEAAREISIMANNERIREDARIAAGIFRHALIGPAQGLVDSAKLLGELALSKCAPEDRDFIAELLTGVSREAIMIRHWRETARSFLCDEVTVRPIRGSFKPLLERCVDRFRGVMREVGLTVEVQLKRPGSIDFHFDANAIDVVLSNLLDNAYKYSYRPGVVIVGCDTDATHVEIWVENVGHPIPERIETQIYQSGGRLDWNDPFREITGQGLGLPMALALVEAHGGTLTHSSEVKRTRQSLPADRTPYEVRFTIRLPHDWNKSRR